MAEKIACDLHTFDPRVNCPDCVAQYRHNVLRKKQDEIREKQMREARRDAADAATAFDPYNTLDSSKYTHSEIYFRPADPQAQIDMGGLHINLTRRYNWFHRWTMRLVFGWRVKNL